MTMTVSLKQKLSQRIRPHLTNINHTGISHMDTTQTPPEAPNFNQLTQYQKHALLFVLIEQGLLDSHFRVTPLGWQYIEAFLTDETPTQEIVL